MSNGGLLVSSLSPTPFIGAGGWPSGDLRPTKKVVPHLPDGTPLHLYQGGDDDTVPLSHLGMFEKVLPHAAIRRLAGRDHQLNNDLSEVAHDIRHSVRYSDPSARVTST